MSIAITLDFHLFCDECDGFLACYCTKRRRFCSSACQQRHRRRNQYRPMRKCKRCGHEFLALRRNKQFCKPGCADLFRAELERRELGVPKDATTKSCASCAKEFKTKRFNQLYCCKRCSWYALNARRISKHRKTSQEPRVSPQLIEARTKAKQAGWTETEERQRRRGRRIT